MEIAQRLQELRKKSNYTQEQVTDLLGISRQAISKWESGQRKPEIDNIIKLTEIYKVSADYILLGQECSIVVEPQPKKRLSRTWQRTIAVMAVVAGTAIITVLFIAALGFLSAQGIS